ncbi:hypothetical protein LMH87_011920 [Akanthomyces muscarius]|uniref:Uncharacterized protein n=1 Tax=Akanthomyces muscarius TaxID=2231603 RepID=A0A9W8ULH7_AKAMU|nr:hypothetical protein LMH87_011920 [Akanthomyces muscarius]KAJ4151206.1 hypothetical protein LMH87_011920 [Akanthomyces muscarius]
MQFVVATQPCKISYNNKQENLCVCCQKPVRSSTPLFGRDSYLELVDIDCYHHRSSAADHLCHLCSSALVSIGRHPRTSTIWQHTSTVVPCVCQDVQ